jgi:hypothetical protein
MIATATGAMLACVAEAEPSRIWFGKGGCVEQHDDGTRAVFVRGELLGVYACDDVASRDVYICFPVSLTTFITSSIRASDCVYQVSFGRGLGLAEQPV